MILGIDTSCYTTSVALARGGEIIADLRKPLKVESGKQGLRQSDGVFMHIKALPELISNLSLEFDLKALTGVIVSTAPRPNEGSYMPVFTVGYSVAKSVASALKVPLYTTSHQEGHIMAALKSAYEPFCDDTFMSVHISGGTSEILETTATDKGYALNLKAATLDLHAGRFIDRIGVMMGLDFPCGNAMDNLGLTTDFAHKLPVTLKGANFHLSGAEAKAISLVKNGEDPAIIARSVLVSIAQSLEKSLYALYKTVPFKNVIIGGGVSASKVIRETLKSNKYFNIHFSDPLYSTDNACGVALIGDLLR